jgi:hypothetical protein
VQGEWPAFRHLRAGLGRVSTLITFIKHTKPTLVGMVGAGCPRRGDPYARRSGEIHRHACVNFSSRPDVFPPPGSPTRRALLQRPHGPFWGSSRQRRVQGQGLPVTATGLRIAVPQDTGSRQSRFV